MANLVQRITGDLTPAESVDPQQNKLPLHGFIGALQEYARGKLTQQNVVDAFNLDVTQTTNLDALRDLYVAAPDKTEFIRVNKDILYLGESNIVVGGNDYRSIATVNTRLQTEVTDQGGTLP